MRGACEVALSNTCQDKASSKLFLDLESRKDRAASPKSLGGCLEKHFVSAHEWYLALPYNSFFHKGVGAMRLEELGKWKINK